MIGTLKRVLRLETLEEKEARERAWFENFNRRIEEHSAERESKYSIGGFERAVEGQEGRLVKGVVDLIFPEKYYGLFGISGETGEIERLRINPTIENPFGKSRYLFNINQSHVKNELISWGDKVAVLIYNPGSMAFYERDGIMIERIANYTTQQAWINTELNKLDKMFGVKSN